MSRSVFVSTRRQTSALRFFAVSLVLLLVAASGFAQSNPVGTAHVQASASPSSPQVGSNFTLNVNVNLSNVTGTGPGGSMPARLGAYQVDVTFNPSKVQYISTAGGTTSGYATPNLSFPNSQTVRMLASASPSSSGNINVARITFQAKVSGNISFSVDPDSLATDLVGSSPNFFGPAIMNGDGSTLDINATEPAPCDDVTVPTNVTVQASGQSGVSYNVTWNSVANATEYEIQEAVTPTFSPNTSTKITAPTHSASFLHSDGSDTTYYYRVRAKHVGGSCPSTSNFSTTVTTTLHAAPVSRLVPIVGSGAGSGGSFFKTSAQFFNPNETQIHGTITFHPMGVSSSDSDPKFEYTMLPGQTNVFPDIVNYMQQAGNGTLELVTTDPLPVGVFRIFNDGGENGTTGFFEEMLNPDSALSVQDSFAIIAPLNTIAARMNIGVRTLGEGATIDVTLQTKDGIIVKQLTKTFPPNFLIQTADRTFLEMDSSPIDNDVVIVRVTAGRLFIYGALTDNKTQDPAILVGRRQN